MAHRGAAPSCATDGARASAGNAGASRAGQERTASVLMTRRVKCPVSGVGCRVSGVGCCCGCIFYIIDLFKIVYR